MSLAPQSIELCDICGKLRVDAADRGMAVKEVME